MNRVDSSMVTTGNELAGYRIVKNYGIVRGIIVRSRSVIGNLGAALQTIIGGNITILTNLCEKTREDAYELLLQHAAQHGANAVIAMRYDATEVMQGVTEVLAYGEESSNDRFYRQQVPAFRYQCLGSLHRGRPDPLDVGGNSHVCLPEKLYAFRVFFGFGPGHDEPQAPSGGKALA